MDSTEGIDKTGFMPITEPERRFLAELSDWAASGETWRVRHEAKATLHDVAMSVGTFPAVVWKWESGKLPARMIRSAALARYHEWLRKHGAGRVT